MKPLNPHERAALGLRQTMSDIECAENHLDTVMSAMDAKIEGLPADIETVKQELSDVLVRLAQCQRQVYANWHETQPPLDYS